MPAAPINSNVTASKVLVASIPCECANVPRTFLTFATPNHVTHSQPEQILRETLNALMEDELVQGVVGSFW